MERFFIYSTHYKEKDLWIVKDYMNTLEHLYKQEKILSKYKLRNVEALKLEDIATCFSKKYFSRLKNLSTSNELTPSNQPIRDTIFDELIACNGMLTAIELAFKNNGLAFHLGSSCHHATRYREGGNCYINTIMVGIEQSRRKLNLKKFLIIDLDVHFPDGTYDSYTSDPSVFQISLHGWGIFPGRGWINKIGSRKAKNTKLNIPLPAGTTGELYITALKKFLPPFIEKSDPEVVIYQAGVDVLHTDKLGNLKLTIEDVFERDKYVYELVSKKYSYPLVTITGGGYSPDSY
ncbi:MAG: histone deacetylase, partial [Candidatus Aenigmatarchaeota archaeon]